MEFLATLGGGSFSLDAAPFDRGNEPPGIGVFLLCLDSGVLPGTQGRAAAHLETGSARITAFAFPHSNEA